MRFFLSLWLIVPFYNSGLLFVKLSIVCQYIRIFRTTKAQKICKVLLFVLTLYGCWSVLGSIFMCIPIKYFWGIGEGKCMNKLIFWFTNAALNITTDIVIFAFPMPLIKTLQVARKQKIALTVLFACGAFVCIISIVRLKSLYAISISTDIPLNSVDCALWSCVEVNTAIVCSSVSTLKPLLAKVFPRILPAPKQSSLEPYNNTFGSHKSKLYGRQKEAIGNQNEIHVNHTFEMTIEDDFASREGSDEVLVDWSADCQSTNEQKLTKDRNLSLIQKQSRSLKINK